MSFYELKEIPITDLLTHLGHRPVSRAKGGRQWFYHSPLREDNNASFCVSSDKNLWYDFGTSRGGNVIDLARGFKQGPPLAASLVSNGPLRPDTEMENIQVLPLTNKALIGYLWSRGIPAEIGRRYCKEVQYDVRDRHFFALCFTNILGGMEIRNPFFKGSYGVKAPSVITLSKSERTPSCCVFEGFMDFLSYQTLLAKYNDIVINPVPRDCIILNPVPRDCIILNSTSMVQKAVPFIQVYDVAFTYLDNDAAGQQATDTIEAAMHDRTIRMSGRFLDFNDLNDYLMSGLFRRP